MRNRYFRLVAIFPLLITLNSACSRSELNKESDSAEKADTYFLLEERQRVIRYNCLNEMTSDRIESVRTPIAHMSIKPKAYSQLDSSSFKNITMNTQAGSILNHTDFTIDFNPGAVNLEVQTGINQINYKFYYCIKYKLPPNETQCALPLELRETGDIYINVTYQKVDLSGEMIIKPSPEQCTP